MKVYYDNRCHTLSFCCPKCGVTNVVAINLPDDTTLTDVHCRGCKEVYEDVEVLHTKGGVCSSNSMVNHPSHYQSETGLEVIDVIEAFTFGLDGVEAFNTGNILKYICRWKHKNGLEDLKKAKWYLEHLINHVEKEKINHD